MKRGWVPLFSLLTGLGATVLVTWLVAGYFEARTRAQFEDAAQAAAQGILKRVEAYVALLRGCTGLFAVQRQASAGEFRAFVDRLRVTEQYPGVQGIGYAARAKAEELEALTARMRGQGMTEFKVWPEGERAEHFPILFLVPQDRRNRAALGYDMGSEPGRLRAMERARDTGGPAASQKVKLVQELEPPHQAGFLIYIPVYREGEVPASEAERRASLQGFVYSPFRADDLMREVVGEQQQGTFDVRVYDGAATATNLLHASEGAADSRPRGRFSSTIGVDVAGRRWNLEFTSQSDFDARAQGGRIPLFFFFAGIALTLVLVYFTNSEARARQAAEQGAIRLRRSREALRQSEERLRLIVESAKDYAIMTLDPAGTVTSWNSGAEALFGYTSQEIIGQNFRSIFTLEDRAARVPEQELAAALGTGRFEDDRWHADKHGRRHFLTGVARAIRDEFGQVQGLIKVTRDITERREIEERIRREKHFIDAAIMSLPGVFYVFDQEGRFVRWNRALEEVTGRSAAEIEGMHATSVLAPDHRQRVAEKIGEAFATGYAQVEAEILTKGERRVPHFFTARRVELDGRPCVVGMGVDITERYEAEKALEEASEQIRRHARDLERLVAERTAHLQQSLASLEGVLYHVAHDLRAPLRAMQGFTSILLKEYAPRFDASGVEYAHRVSEAAERMDRLIHDLLEYGRLGHAPLPIAAISAEDSVNHVLADLGGEIEAKSAQITVERPLPVVAANTTALDAIFSNLLSNALKFVPPGVSPRVRVRAEERDGMVRLIVEDKGIGIDPKYIDRVFRVFERLEKPDAYPGTGIGLAIVHKAVERMHGEVGVSSLPGQGTVFWVELPKSK